MLKSNFEKLPLRQKIQLYLIVIISLLLLFIFLEKFIFIEKVIPSHINKLTIKSLSNKIVVKNNKQLLEYIESQLVQEKIFIQAITTTEQTISLDISGTFDTLMQILYRLEQHLIIEQFSFNKSDVDGINVNSKIVFLNHYFINENRKDTLPHKIKNPFENKNFIITKNEDKNITVEQKMIKFNAIVNDEVFMEGKWYGKGDIFHEYTIVTIESDLIKLLDRKTNNMKTIKLEDEEK